MSKFCTQRMVPIYVVLELLVLTQNAVHGTWFSYSAEELIIPTCYGKVRGQILFSRCQRVFYAFKGIPYAAPPVGNLRFAPPAPPERWDDVLEADEDGPMCIQKNYLFSEKPEVEGSEDCLYLNVYTPRLPNAELIKLRSLLPVMVFIHYGGFFAGTGNSDYIGPEYFMDKDVVLVTFNYRLGVFGFLSTNDDAAPGNWGLKDQVAVLKWVQDNIGEFGGNNKKVTIFGQSAGAASVHYHLLSPTTMNLFHGAISQSGTTLALWARPHSAEQALVAAGQAMAVGCGDHIGDTSDMIECLRKVNATVLAASIASFKSFHSEPFVIYGPVTERKTKKNPNPYITEDPLKLISAGKFRKIPWIVGVVADEGILRAAPLLRQSATQTLINADFNNIVPQILGLALSINTSSIPMHWEQISKHFHIENAIDVNKTASVQGFIDLYSDRSFIYASYQSALLHALKGHNSVWFYNFAYRGRYSYGEHFAGTSENINFKWGVSHCDDLIYLFPSPRLFEPLNSVEDLLMSKAMIYLWTSFATYGHPVPRHEEFLPRWNPLHNLENVSSAKNADLFYLNISGPYKPDEDAPIKFEIKNEFYPKRMRFWNSLELAERIKEVD